MVKKNIIILSLMFLIVLTFVNGTISTSGRQHYWNFSSDMKDEWKGITFSCSGVDFTATDGARFLTSDYCSYSTDKTLVTALTNFTMCIRYNVSSLPALTEIWDEMGASKGIHWRIRDNTGYKHNFGMWNNPPDATWYGTTTVTTGAKHTQCIVYNGNSDNGEMIFDNTNETGFNSPMSANDEGIQINFGQNKENSGTGASFFNGLIYELCVWNRTLAQSELTEFNTYGCEGQTGPVADTTKPVISNVTQQPFNTSVTNLATKDLNISAKITDNVAVDNVNLTIKLNRTEIFINGTLQNYNQTYAQTFNSSSYYEWVFDETDFLGGTYFLSPSYMFNTPHSNFSFQGTNRWLKYKFLNISNKIQSNFYEDMANNLSTTEGFSEYYYCNSTYTTGNPTLSSYCVLFGSVSNKANYHSHNKSFHRVVPLGINTTSGKIGNIKVTPISYILKRGTTQGENIYYVPKTSRADAHQISINNGVAFTNLHTYLGVAQATSDVHIHQISDKAQILYRVCGTDTSQNSNCTTYFSNTIDFLNLPPNAVTFYSPVTNQTYTDSFLINHTQSFTTDGQTITSYAYYYKKNTTTTWTHLTNLTPATINSYTWDFSTGTSGYYDLKLEISDSNNDKAYQYVEDFYLQVTSGLDTELLQDILDELTEVNQATNSLNQNIAQLLEVIELLGSVLLWIATTLGGLYLIYKRKMLSGIILFAFSFIFDFVLNAYYMDEFLPLVDAGSFSGILYGIMINFLVLWLIAKVSVAVGLTIKN